MINLNSIHVLVFTHSFCDGGVILISNHLELVFLSLNVYQTNKNKMKTMERKHCIRVAASVPVSSTNDLERWSLPFNSLRHSMLICHRPLLLSMKHLRDIISLSSDILGFPCVTPSCEYTQSTARWLGNECDVIEREDEKQSERERESTMRHGHNTSSSTMSTMRRTSMVQQN